MTAQSFLQGKGAWLAVWWLGLAVAQGLLVVGSFLLVSAASGTVALWLPAGFALATVLQLGYRVWPGIALGMTVTPLLLDAVPVAMAWRAPVAVAEALLAAWMIRRWVAGGEPLSHVTDIIRFIALVALATLPFAMTEGLVWGGPGGEAGPRAVLEWWLGNVAGMLIFAPFALAWFLPAYAPAPGRHAELALLAVLSLLAADLVFGGMPQAGSLEFLLLGFFIWAALRLEVRGMTTLTLVTALAAAYHTGRGRGPFIAPTELVTLLTLQGFAVISTVTGLILIAATHERREALEALQLAGKVIENTPDGVMITDSAMRIRSVNPAFTATTGYREDEVVGKTPRLLSSGRHDAAFYREMWTALGHGGRWQGEIWNRRKNGEIYLEWLNVIAIRDDHGQVLYYAGIFSDIVTQEHVRKRLHSLAYYDALTDLPNRELFHDRLYNAVVQARREGRQMALMFLDVDRFKPINDTHGHSVGDSLLKVIGNVLRLCVRESDTVARLGGDEFTIVLTSLAGPEDAVQVAGKILAAFARPFQVEGHALSVGISIGVALYPDDAHDEAMLLRNADAAMYAAKQAGRNNFQRFKPYMAATFNGGGRGT
jgi:diguanylate cyclase (GGDEF)-like protein/PAS domain S-box-containing protein